MAGVAGGVVESAEDLAALRGTDAFVVYLHTPVDVLVERVGDGAGRPWLQPDPETALRTLFAGREPLYREVADVVVDTSTGDADAHADQVVQAMQGRSCRASAVDAKVGDRPPGRGGGSLVDAQVARSGAREVQHGELAGPGDGPSPAAR